MILALLKVGALAGSCGLAVGAAILGLSTAVQEDRTAQAAGFVMTAFTATAAVLLAVWVVTS